jgi:conjugative transfer signal peptidase TraF
MPKKSLIGGALLFGIAILGTAMFQSKNSPVLLYNPTESAPKGWYFVHKTEAINVGDMVAANLSRDASTLASNRGYLPSDIPVIKTVWAMEGDEYCIEDNWFTVSDRPPLRIHTLDGRERAMPELSGGCRRVSEGKYILISERIDTSFDSRYFGEVGHNHILGRVDLVWEDRR